MKTQKLTTILAALILLSAAIAQEGEQDQKEKVSNTLTASCLVKVTCDPAILPLTLETIDYLMHSSGVAGGATAERGLPRDESHDFFSVEALSSDAGSLTTEPSSVIPTRLDLGAFSPEQPKPAYRPTRSRRSPQPFGRSDELEFQRHSQRPGKVMVPKKSEVAGPRRGARRTPTTGKIARRRQWQSTDAPLPPPSVAERTLLFRLRIELPEEIKPTAEEFMNALINNFRETLMAAYHAYHQKVDHKYAAAEGYRDWARDRLSEALGLTSDTDADLATRKQLDEIVDLSALSPEMPFGEAIELLQDSVGPPLKLIVLWRDLQEHTANIDQTTPINMDPISAIPSGKALELLLKSVSTGDAPLSYEIDRGVITIATVDSLPSAERRLSQITYTDTPVETLLERRNGLFRDKQELELEIARYEAHLPALEGQIARINEQVTKRLAADPVTVELQKIAELHLDRVAYFKKL
ncbi:MAG: hypothetical protein ACYTEQ_22000, partial [Planctomycetota bacterium]